MEGSACEECGARRALVRLTSADRGRLLCDDCFAAAASSVSNPRIDLARFYYLLAHPTSEPPHADGADIAKDARCAACGTTYAELAHEGLLGCPACYEAFAPAVAQALWTIQGVVVSTPVAR
jgi:protein arginine kinase activator